MRDRAVRFSEYIMGKNVAVGSNALGSSDQNSRFAATSLSAAGVNLNMMPGITLGEAVQN